MKSNKYKLKYWRDHDGPEVDYVIDTGNNLVPIEVKYTDQPGLKDAKHLNIFLKEYPRADKGYIVCRCPRPVKIEKQVIGMPWIPVHRISICL